MKARISFSSVTIAITLALLCAAEPTYAQSAADKATARELASDGIKRLKAGDAIGALKKLEKAQALYDAPIHLLYIARAHVGLGDLVEGAETYRTLARAHLTADAPGVFHDAQRDGAEELEKLEPRIGRLTVDVLPEDIAGLEVTIDQKSFNVAALGVPRASNPGHHVITAKAPGFVLADTQVDVGEGKSVSVKLKLKAQPATAGEVAAEKEEQDHEEETKDPKSTDGFKTGPMGIILGIKMGGVLPLGQLESGTAISQYFGPGFGGRIDIGFRFVKHLGIKGYIGGAILQYGNALTDYAQLFQEGSSSGFFVNQREAGAALLITSDPRKVGAFGEIGIGMARAYSWKHNYDDGSCTSEASYSGWSTRIGGGVNVPFGEFFTLVPTVDFTLGQLGKRKYKYGCTDVVSELPDVESDSLNTALHYQLFFGVGGDFHFGDDWFR